MNKSSNYGMSLPQYNNVVDIDVLNANINVIDNGLSPFYVATQSGANTYKVTTGINKTSLVNGYSIKVAIPSDSNGAVSVIIDTCSAVPVKKPNGSAVTNFKQNGVYSLTYYNSVFILASGGVDDVNFSASDLLSGKTANNSDGEKVTGTMPNIGQQTATINAGGKVTISKGYHDGTGYVQSNSMSTQLSNLGVTLTSASQLVKDVKAVNKNGSLITGTATIQSLGGLEIKTGSGVYTPTYKVGTNKYGDKYLDSETLTIPLNLDFDPKIFIVLVPILSVVHTELCPFVWDMYSKKFIPGVVNYSYGSTSSSETWDGTSSSKNITSIPRNQIDLIATNVRYSGTWKFESTGSVSDNTLNMKPVSVTWFALG